MSTMELVSQREFARINNWNPGYVAKLKTRGTLVMRKDDQGRELVDVTASMERLAESRDPKKNYMREVNDRQRTAHNKSLATGPDAGSAPAVSSNATFNTARTAAQVYEAKLKQLDYEAKVGKLVNASEVASETFQKARIARDALMSIKARLSPQLAAEMDPVKIEAMLDVELRAICAELAAGEDSQVRN